MDLPRHPSQVELLDSVNLELAYDRYQITKDNMILMESIVARTYAEALQQISVISQVTNERITTFDQMWEAAGSVGYKDVLMLVDTLLKQRQHKHLDYEYMHCPYLTAKHTHRRSELLMCEIAAPMFGVELSAVATTPSLRERFITIVANSLESARQQIN